MFLLASRLLLFILSCFIHPWHILSSVIVEILSVVTPGISVEDCGQWSGRPTWRTKSDLLRYCEWWKWRMQTSFQCTIAVTLALSVAHCQDRSPRILGQQSPCRRRGRTSFAGGESLASGRRLLLLKSGWIPSCRAALPAAVADSKALIFSRETSGESF